MSVINYSRGTNKYDNCPIQMSSDSFEEFQETVLSDRSSEKGKAYI